MTRTVFDNAMVAHVWAQMTQDSGRSGNGNFFFEGRALYSYGRHYVAGFLLAPGRALVNADSYSISTSRHVRYTERALSYRGLQLPGLTQAAAILSRAFDSAYPRDPKAVAADLAKWAEGEALPKGRAKEAYGRVSRRGLPDFPAIDSRSLVAAFESLGLTSEKAEALTRSALGKRARNSAAWEAAKAAADLAELLESAKRYAARPLADLRGELLAETRGPYFRAERHGAEWLGIAKRHFRAAKAAKAKGWARVSAEVKARESLIRATVKGWPEIEAAANARAYIRESFKMFRQTRAFLQAPAADLAQARAGYVLAEALNRAEGLGLIYPRGGVYVKSPHSRAELGRIMGRAGLLTKEAGQGWERWAEACRGLSARLGRIEARAEWRKRVAAVRKARAEGPDSIAAPVFSAARSALLYAGDSGWALKTGNPFRAAGWTQEALKAESARMAEAEKAATQRKREAAERAESEWRAACRAAWVKGEAMPDKPMGIPFYSGRSLDDGQGGALIRAEGVQRDESGRVTGGTLRTSQGAQVPLAHAIRAFRFLALCRARGQGWAANGKTLPVGHFRIESIDAAGNFKAGCHRINWPEVARLAADLGVADLAPADTTESRESALA